LGRVAHSLLRAAMTPNVAWLMIGIRVVMEISIGKFAIGGSLAYWESHLIHIVQFNGSAHCVVGLRNFCFDFEFDTKMFVF
jgi:hypothetical protein